ncbi:ATP-binding cassette sub-family A member 3 [Reticulomyxa filosa]|uniref:ATP-binding cassette sub-family A member 3 n=1 Tax=Reticulomyxa filosa TaxID=46433 RepID=X6NQ85_RETFI|nr:ATP-binding cassette sub-family A member 3 [Reticulomyxa filosa]|eukprot:ETO28440.1 ATP-binding cassette sub-family A member 3 [Reticulomyxa filosa]
MNENIETASMVSTIFLLVLYFINFLYQTLRSESDLTALCLSGPACFAVSTNNFAIFEEGQLGIQWDNMDQVYNYFRFQTAIYMMIIDCIIYTILALSLCFLLFDTNYAYVYERVDENVIGKPVITVENLRKEYSTGFNTQLIAVDGVNLKMYENQVFCLLGHNGAGKTTTISMLSGMTSISGGRAILDGFDVVNNMLDIRKEMGVCPQHDVLWPNLSVEEHLRLFARLKGVTADKVEAEVNDMVQRIGLLEKRAKFPTELSGGQKRKLSLGIALIGGSKIVFLDV